MKHSKETVKLYTDRGLSKPRLLGVSSSPLMQQAPLVGMNSMQKAQIATWAEQRDSILREISVNSSDNEILVKQNKALAESNTDLMERNLRIEGSITSMTKIENDRVLVESKELSKTLLAKKQAEGELAVIRKEVELLTSQKGDLKGDIAILLDTHDRVYKRSSVLDKVVERVTRLNEENITKVNIFVSELQKAIKGATASVTSLSLAGDKKANELNRVTAKKAMRDGGIPNPSEPLGKEGSSLGNANDPL